MLWDSAEHPPPGEENVWCWQGYGDQDGTAAVPRYLESHSTRLRARYIGFIHDFGQTVVNGNSVVGHLKLEPGLSLWWMTRLAEKSPFKSARVFDCLRLLALSEMLQETVPETLECVTADDALGEAVARLCRSRDIAFVRRRGKIATGDARRESLFRRLPPRLQAFLWLAHRMVTRPHFAGTRASWWASGKNAALFVSYIVNVDSRASAQNRFESRYWEKLPDFVKASGRGANWLHLFIPTALAPTLRSGRALLRNFASGSNGSEGHRFLDEFQTPRVILAAVRNWIRISSVATRLRALPKALESGTDAPWLWPLLGKDWNDSVTGRVAMENVLTVELMDSVLRSVPRQEIGLYLCENLAWERALIHAWHKYGHGKLVAVVHSTVRFWDLRYSDDVRTIADRGELRSPYPDVFALNGPVALEAFREIGYPPDALAPVEAVRYLSLRGLAASREAGPADGVEQNSGPVRVLVLGDILPEPTRQLLRLLERAVTQCSRSVQLTFKAHPANQVNLADYPTLAAATTTEPLATVLGRFDIIISANPTSAALDAYVAGKRVAVHLNGSDFNFSPLRGVDGVPFVSDPRTLAAEIENSQKPTRQTKRTEFFWLDPDLPRWQTLLGTAGLS